MNNLIETYEKKQINKLISKKNIPTFRPGDTIKVNIKIFEGERSRIQAFEGICIARKNKGINSNFTIRKISHGEGVERVFSLFSTMIDKIEVIRKGNVKRAKLYYLRDRKGKSARISDKDRGDEANQYESLNIEESNEKNEVKTDENKTVAPESNNKLEEKKDNNPKIASSSEKEKPIEHKTEKNPELEKKSDDGSK